MENIESINNIELIDNMQTFQNGILPIITNICDRINFDNIIDSAIDNSQGRPLDISYGTLTKMFIGSICDDYHPLYLMQEYFKNKDIEGLYGVTDINKLNDQRFEKMLDRIYEANPREIFSSISFAAFKEFGIKVNNINYDTTSKVMWGEYDTPEGKISSLEITYGHSKQKRSDKKQLKIGLGTAGGVVIDAIVIDGNKDDKTYNKENIDDAKEIIERFKINVETFHYVADSALFTKENLKKLNEKDNKILFITRAPDNINVIKEMMEESVKTRENYQKVVIRNAQEKDVKYDILSKIGIYEEYTYQFVVCYSYSLVSKKEKTMERWVEKEAKLIEKDMKLYEKRNFSCEKDANLEIEMIINKKVKSYKYHKLSIKIESEEKIKKGRKSKIKQKIESEIEYKLTYIYEKNEEIIKNEIEKQSTFVLASNDLKMTGEEILNEYKKQTEIEQKFKALKSPLFMNSLFLKTPERIEALTYLFLIALMFSSIIEYLVRQGLKEEEKTIIGPGQVKMTKPTYRSIYRMFQYIITYTISLKTHKIRRIERALNDSQKTILRLLNLDEKILIENTFSKKNA